MADTTDRAGADAAGAEQEHGRARETARDLKDRAESTAESLGAEAKDRGREAIREGKEKARELKDEARREARSRADEQKDRVAEGIRSVAQALRHGTRELPEERRQYGRFMETMADRVEDVSGYLDEHDVDGMVRDAKRFARDNTAVFLGGAFTLGMAGARFLKSTDTHGDDRGSDRASRGLPREEALSGEPGSTMHEPTRQHGDPLADRKPARPYPRSSTAREATERVQEEGGYA